MMEDWNNEELDDGNKNNLNEKNYRGLDDEDGEESTYN